MKKCLEVMRDFFAPRGKSGCLAEKGRSGAVGGVFYVSSAEAKRLRKELEKPAKPAKPDSKFAELMRNKGGMKWEDK